MSETAGRRERRAAGGAGLGAVPAPPVFARESEAALALAELAERLGTSRSQKEIGRALYDAALRLRYVSRGDPWVEDAFMWVERRGRSLASASSARTDGLFHGGRYTARLALADGSLYDAREFVAAARGAPPTKAVSELAERIERRVAALESETPTMPVVSGAPALDVAPRSPHAERFEAVDRLVSCALAAWAAGEPLFEDRFGRAVEAPPRFGVFEGDQRVALERWFGLERQRASGGWHVPAKAALALGVGNLAAAFEHFVEIPTAVAHSADGRFDLAASADAVYYWAVVSPLLEGLAAPLLLRGARHKALSSAREGACWREFDLIAAALGVDLDEDARVFRPACGWSLLRSPERELERKQRFAVRLRRALGTDAARAYRELSVAALVDAYRQKGRGEPVPRERVLTDPLGRTLSAYFGGDWLAFLDFVGSRPHPRDRIVTAIPEPRIVVGSREAASDVAGALAVSPDAVSAVLASFWAVERPRSPMQERSETMRRYWAWFDDLHARHESDGFAIDRAAPTSRPRRGIGMDRGILYAYAPDGLLDEIELWWGTEMDEKPPYSVRASGAPAFGIARAFWPALRFWHGVGVTVIRLNDDARLPNTIAGAEAHYREELAALAALGAAVDPRLFAELDEVRIELGLGDDIVNAFEKRRKRAYRRLRDVVTRHRRAWSQEYLETYLRASWETRLREVARWFEERVARRGKAPPERAFVKMAGELADDWFGGNLETLCASIGHAVPRARAADVTEPRAGDPLDALLATAFPRPAKLGDAMWRARLRELARLASAAAARERRSGSYPSSKQLLPHRLAYCAKSFGLTEAAAWRRVCKALSTLDEQKAAEGSRAE